MKLVAKRLDVSFGGVHALDGVSLEIPGGSLVGLIGPNGAGKTTCIDALSGFVQARGSVSIDDRELTRMSAYRRARAGVTRTFQSLELFNDLTVRENLAVAAERPRWWDLLADVFSLIPRGLKSPRLDEVGALLGVTDLMEERPDSLSLGQQKLVSVGRALASDPKILLLDEPAAGLDTDATMEFGEVLPAVTKLGTGVLLVDHDMALVLSVCDYVYVLEFGKLIAQGTPSEIRSNPRVIEAYLGSQEAGLSVPPGDPLPTPAAVSQGGVNV